MNIYYSDSYFYYSPTNPGFEADTNFIHFLYMTYNINSHSDKVSLTTAAEKCADRDILWCKSKLISISNRMMSPFLNIVIYQHTHAHAHTGISAMS